MSKQEFKLWFKALDAASETGPGNKCPSTKLRFCPCDLLWWFQELNFWYYELYLDDPFLGKK